jgi:GntR family transcriptional repressor for pyruvate dehydrogenase complex
MQNLLREAKKKKLFQEIVRQITRLIKSGKVRRGDKLPAERDLAQTFRVSRASVREAIRVLESEGLVQTRVGDGTYVVTSPVEDLITPLATAVTVGREALVEIFAVRKMVEPEIAFLAAERRSTEEIRALEKILRRQRNHLSEPKSVTEIDYSFHRLLAKMSRSEVYWRLYNTLTEMINQTREELLQEGDRPLKSVEGHEEIIRAIREGNARASKRAMLAHLRKIEQECLRASS